MLNWAKLIEVSCQGLKGNLFPVLLRHWIGMTYQGKLDEESRILAASPKSNLSAREKER